MMALDVPDYVHVGDYVRINRRGEHLWLVVTEILDPVAGMHFRIRGRVDTTPSHSRNRDIHFGSLLLVTRNQLLDYIPRPTRN